MYNYKSTFLVKATWSNNSNTGDEGHKLQSNNKYKKYNTNNTSASQRLECRILTSV